MWSHGMLTGYCEPGSGGGGGGDAPTGSGLPVVVSSAFALLPAPAANTLRVAFVKDDGSTENLDVATATSKMLVYDTAAPGLRAYALGGLRFNAGNIHVWRLDGNQYGYVVHTANVRRIISDGGVGGPLDAPPMDSSRERFHFTSAPVNEEVYRLESSESDMMSLSLQIEFRTNDGPTKQMARYDRVVVWELEYGASDTLTVAGGAPMGSFAGTSVTITSDGDGTGVVSVRVSAPERCDVDVIADLVFA